MQRLFRPVGILALAMVLAQLGVYLHKPQSTQPISFRVIAQKKKLKIPFIDDLVTEPGIVVSEQDIVTMLDWPNVTLHRLTESQGAILVETPSNIDVHSSEVASFLYEAQVQHAVHILHVPWKAFRQHVEDKLDGPPRCRSLFVWSTGRCGSTLLAQVFETQERVYSISEPLSLLDGAKAVAPKHAEGKVLFGEDPATLLSIALRYQLRGFPADSLVVVKTHSQAVSVAHLVAEVLPKSRHLYLYRDAWPNLMSFIRIFRSALPKPVAYLPACGWPGRMLLHGVIFRFFRPGWASMRFIQYSLVDDDELASRFTYPSFSSTVPNLGELVMLVSNLRVGLRILQSGTVNNMRSLRYEDFTSSQDTISNVLRFSGLPAHREQVTLAWQALQKDSQRMSGVSKEATGASAIDFSDKEIAVYDSVLAAFNIPSNMSKTARLQLPKGL